MLGSVVLMAHHLGNKRTVAPFPSSQPGRYQARGMAVAEGRETSHMPIKAKPKPASPEGCVGSLEGRRFMSFARTAWAP